MQTPEGEGAEIFVKGVKEKGVDVRSGVCVCVCGGAGNGALAAPKRRWKVLEAVEHKSIHLTC